jgi:hypothetical protein
MTDLLTGEERGQEVTTVYLVCFVLGLVMSLLAVFTGLGRVHLGHIHFGHAPVPTHLHARAGGQGSGQLSVINGFTLPAFLCWFGGVGYLLRAHTGWIGAAVALLAAVSGMGGAAVIYGVLFKVLLPRERVLTEEETRMDGVVARVSDEIRADGGVGEILFSQTGARRSAAAKSETGAPIARGTEVVVLHYERGVAWVSPLDDA